MASLLTLPFKFRIFVETNLESKEWGEVHKDFTPFCLINSSHSEEFGKI